MQSGSLEVHVGVNFQNTVASCSVSYSGVIRKVLPTSWSRGFAEVAVKKREAVSRFLCRILLTV